MIMRSIVLFVLAGIPSIAQDAATPRKEVNRYSIEKEAALGKQLAAEFRGRTTAIDSPGVQEYLENLGQELASEMPKTGFRFTFSVVGEDSCPLIHEPHALPGGYVFVPAALFVAAKDEAEFAGMVAHAMVHIVERHGIQQAKLPEPSPAPKAPVTFLGGLCNHPGVVPMGFLKLQTTFEREADLLAVETMSHAGFDPNALVRYTERVQPPLPLTKDRIASMLSVISKLPRSNYPAAASGEFQAAREAVLRVLPQDRSTPPSFMPNPRQ
jgi:predicted Zn-dependent protease